MRKVLLSALVGVGLIGSQALAGLIDTRTDTTAGGATVDGTLGANEYGPGNSYSYAGGGSGFGGTVGAGLLYMNSDATNLYIGFQAGNNLNDNVVIHLDTRAGGQIDATMDDQADPGRNLSSNLTRDVDDVFPINFLPDFSAVIGQFGNVVFELTAGNTPGHLNFISFDGSQTGNNPALFRELAIPLATLGNPTQVDFLVSYGSDSNFMSNESIPFDAFNGGPNPGFDNNGTFQPIVRDNFDRFVTFVVPEPASLSLLALGAFGLLRRRAVR